MALCFGVVVGGVCAVGCVFSGWCDLLSVLAIGLSLAAGVALLNRWFVC